MEFNERIKGYYSWEKVAKKTVLLKHSPKSMKRWWKNLPKPYKHKLNRSIATIPTKDLFIYSFFVFYFFSMSCWLFFNRPTRLTGSSISQSKNIKNTKTFTGTILLTFLKTRNDFHFYFYSIFKSIFQLLVLKF